MNENKRKKAEKAKRYREKIKGDPQKLESARAKEKERYKKKIEAGKCSRTNKIFKLLNISI